MKFADNGNVPPWVKCGGEHTGTIIQEHIGDDFTATTLLEQIGELIGKISLYSLASKILHKLY